MILTRKINHLTKYATGCLDIDCVTNYLVKNNVLKHKSKSGLVIYIISNKMLRLYVEQIN